MKKEIESLLYRYHIEDYLNGRLQYDEFLEDIQSFIVATRKDIITKLVQEIIDCGTDTNRVNGDTEVSMKVRLLRKIEHGYLTDKKESK